MDRKEVIGSRIKEYRMKQRMTQADLAKAIGQSTSSIGMYESGKRAPEMDALKSMADVFGVSVTEMMAGNETEQQKDQARIVPTQEELTQAFMVDQSRAINTLETMRKLLDMSFPRKQESGNSMSAEDLERLEALHQNPKLGLLFDRSRKMSHEDVELMLRLAEKITGERSKSDD